MYQIHLCDAHLILLHPKGLASQPRAAGDNPLCRIPSCFLPFPRIFKIVGQYPPKKTRSERIAERVALRKRSRANTQRLFSFPLLDAGELQVTKFAAVLNLQFSAIVKRTTAHAVCNTSEELIHNQEVGR